MPAMFQSLCFLGLSTLLLTLPAPARAQTEEVGPSPLEGTVTDLRVEPRYTIDYNSSGGGYEGFGGFEVFLPLEQVPGKTVSFAIGRVNLSHSADVSGNLQIGRRSLGNCWLIGGECLFGGYFGVDFTNTGAALFPQLGVGVEMLGDLDLRLNGYLPIGDTSRTVSEGTFVSATGSQFQGNNLIFFDANHPGLAEVALMGLDAEVGGRLVQFGNGGDLRGYGGVYTYGGSGINQYWGGRFRLEARPTPNLIFGAGVQFDDEFGTNVLFRVGATLPNPAQRQRFEQAPLSARLSESPGRLNSVVVAEQVLLPPTQIAIDPASGEPYNFIHVAPGRGNSSGTVEDPTNTVAEAVAVATPETDIIYVQSGNAGGGFTIPDGVAVLSVAPVQWVETQIGALQLPGSGQGEAARPLISDTVTMGNDTVLSGFVVEPPPTRIGILVENSGNVQVTSNTVRTNNALTSILVNNTRVFPGTVAFSDNQINAVGTGENSLIGIQVTSNSSATLSGNTISVSRTGGTSGSFLSSPAYGISTNGEGSIIITGNDINMTGDFSDVCGICNSDSLVTISGNRLFLDVTSSHYYRPGVSGISSRSTNIINGSNNSAIITDNVLDMATYGFSGLSGISVSRMPAIISNNSVRIDRGAGSVSGISSYYSGSTTISGNVLTIVGDTSVGITGIRRESLDGSTLISNNIINFTGNYDYGNTRGISFSGNSSVISGNTINVDGIIGSSVYSNGVQADGIDFEISNNTINSNGVGILITRISSPFLAGFSSRDFTISGNTINTIRTNTYQEAHGVFVMLENGDNNFIISDNVISTDGLNSDGINVVNDFIGPGGGGSENVINNMIISGNIIQRTGRDSVHINNLPPPEPGQSSHNFCVTLSNNISQNPGSSIGYHLINPALTFRIVDSSPTFADTQASNIGTFSFEPNINRFTNVVACPQN